MGAGQSKKQIEEEFQIHKVEDNGNALLRSRQDEKDYLMRVVSCTNQGDLERLKTLLESRAQIKSPHLLSLVEIKEKQQDFICSVQYKMYLVLQYSFKNTAEQIKERTKNNQLTPFQQSDLWSILYSCCTALHALYGNGVSHECLTSEQIFINKDGFVKIAQPLLFGLEKNHLEAMRTKDSGYVHVHLSPEIMNCLQDQNFFYYEKEKSDIFILAMIVIDLALLKHNYLYDVQKRKPHLDNIPVLLKKVGERYSGNFTAILSEMLRIDSKMRPSLTQIVERVQKCNNIGQDFTLETESNMKSHDISTDRHRDKIIFEKAPKYIELEKKEELILDQSRQTRTVKEKVIYVKVPQQPSLSINEQTQVINQQNFDGRVFTTTPHQSYHHSSQSQGFPSNFYPREGSPVQPQPPPPPIHIQNPQLNQPSYSNPPVNFQTFRKDFDLYERSRSIDSIKMGSSEFTRLQQFRNPQSANKPLNAFSSFENQPPPNLPSPPAESFKKQQYQFRKSSQPLFTHQIPQVYNLLVKSTKPIPKTEVISSVENNLIMKIQNVSTPQFQGQAEKVNRFTSFKYQGQEVISRVSEDNQPSPFSQLQMKKNISHTKSETYQVDKRINELDSMAKAAQSPIAFPPHASFSPPQPPGAKFSSSKVAQGFEGAHFSGSAASLGTPLIRKDIPFNANSAVSYTFSPGKHQYGRQSESYTRRSGFDQVKVEEPDPNVEYVKEDIPERGRYEGYKLYDQRNGHGILYFKDGGHYDGQWKQDKMHGFGKLYYENGSIAYEGHWQNDEFNGQGRVYNMEPQTFIEQFNYKDFSELGNKWTYYDGQFKNDSKHGKGYIKLTNGEMFEGVFDHDMIEGNGIFYKRSGEIIIGFWIDNKLFLNQSYEHDKK